MHTMMFKHGLGTKQTRALTGIYHGCLLWTPVFPWRRWDWGRSEVEMENTQ